MQLLYIGTRREELDPVKNFSKSFFKKGKNSPFDYIGLRRVDKSFGNGGAADAERNNCIIRRARYGIR